jgi:Carboxypeptidase regulatory-like domain/Ankyrin repeats (3 copies)/Ankyrin repeats (many copies)
MSRKSFIDSVNVKSPCGEDWDKMTGSEKVRFCSHCSKDVNNISEMTRKEATRLIRDSDGRLCIRYVVDPATKSPLFADQLLRITRRAPAVASGVMSASIALSASAYAQGEVRETVTAAVAGPPPITTPRSDVRSKSGGSARLTGTVADQMGGVIVGAKVELFSVEAAKTGSTETNSDGVYAFNDLAPGNYLLEITSPGFLKNSRRVAVAEKTDAVVDSSLEIGGFELTVEVKSDVEMEGAAVTVGGAIAVVEYTSELSSAVADEDVDRVRELIIKGANVNAKEDSYSKITPLFIAVETGDIEIVQLLLDNGAKINAQDKGKQTPLMRLDDDATTELVRLLVRYGAKVNAADKQGNTALTLAAGGADAEVIKALIDAGADVNAASKSGQTALMQAAENDDLESVKLLLEAGARVNAKNKAGETAWDLASDDKVEKLLETYGGISGDPEMEEETPPHR